MNGREQVVEIGERVTAFTAVCAECEREPGEPGRQGATFAGRLDLDLDGGVFLCRKGHRLRVGRRSPLGTAATEAA